ncbi:MAG: adenosylcobinamide-GDP ribazoletransferase [Prevotella sp.]|nr:adenosylcobinamide-GDP ribazoletransferase [Prevotella sp.]
MRISLNNHDEKWYDNLWAALIFFTRLPFWRIHQPPRHCYEAVVEYWPLSGWLTGGLMAVILYFGGLVFPHSITVLLAIVCRILITGALHEDGLTDFFDGFGGGSNNRIRILAIMKDSRIGTYGVLGIVIYLLLLFFCLYTMSPAFAALAVFAADPYSKMLAGQATMMLPYARTEDDSKAHVVYRNMNIRAGIFMFFQGILPLAALLYLCHGMLRWDLIIFVPGIVMYFLYLFIWKKLRGYTGDCCGALFLLIELSFYICISTQFINTQSLWTLF